MAMFEKEGYCPSSAFLHYGETYKVSPLWKKVQETLGDRIDYMVYTQGGNSYKGGFIVDALEGGDGILGLQVVTALKVLIPRCESDKGRGKKILCTDIVNPSAIPSGIIEYEGKWKWIPLNTTIPHLFDDNRYLIVIEEHKEHVRIYIYKK